MNGNPPSVVGRYLPEFDVRGRRTRLMRAEVGPVQAAITQTDVTTISVVRALLDLRALPGRMLGLLGSGTAPAPPPLTLASDTDMPRAGVDFARQGSGPGRVPDS